MPTIDIDRVARTEAGVVAIVYDLLKRWPVKRSSTAWRVYDYVYLGERCPG